MRVILVTALPNSQGWLVKEEGNEWLHHWTGQGSFTALSSNGGGGLHAGQFIELPEYDAEAQLKAFNDSELTALLQGERETKIQVTFDLTLGHRLTDDDFDILQILDQAQSARAPAMCRWAGRSRR